MIYSFAITTPYNTSEENKQRAVLKLAKGIIHQIDVILPSGLAGTTHVQINRGRNQVWPSNSDGNFTGEDDRISFAEFYELETKPYQLEVYTWNTSTAHDHLIIVRIGLLPKKIVLRKLF